MDCSDRPICNEADEQCYAEGESICSTVDCSQDGYVAEGSCEKCLCECEGGDAEELCCSSGMRKHDISPDIRRSFIIGFII